MRLDSDGARHFPAALTPDDLTALDRLFAAHLPDARPGVRLGRLPALPPLIGAADAIARAALGALAQPVRAVLFDKSPARNWALGWHQDRTIAVEFASPAGATPRGHPPRFLEIPGYTGWTLKGGIPHVVPPFEILARMLTLRLHLDHVGDRNAPLLIAPGSHRLGRILEADIAGIVAAHGSLACRAARGDIWAYAAPILHASEAAAEPARRRVLQLYYSADPLADDLDWFGV
ncbi:MAG TPA: phytanoyl-CoA dioxygenase [Allosphingosinicella sp.]|jgi:hypothetical protein